MCCSGFRTHSALCGRACAPCSAIKDDEELSKSCCRPAPQVYTYMTTHAALLGRSAFSHGKTSTFTAVIASTWRTLNDHFISLRVQLSSKMVSRVPNRLFPIFLEHTAAEHFNAAIQDRSTTYMMTRVRVDRRANLAPQSGHSAGWVWSKPKLLSQRNRGESIGYTCDST